MDTQPISVHPILSKVYEKVILSRMTTFIEKKLLNHKYRSKHWKNNPTTTLLLKRKDNIDKAINCSEMTLLFQEFYKGFEFFTKITQTTFF